MMTRHDNKEVVAGGQGSLLDVNSVTGVVV